MDQAVHTGHDLGERAEGHQLHDAHVGHIAHVVGSHELIPGIHAAVLHAQRDLVLLGIEGDNVHVQGIPHGDDLGGVLNTAPGQLGDMYHTIHAADVHEHAIAGHGLHGAGVVLADLDVVPDLRLGGLTGLIGHGLDGADDAAAGTVDLGDPQGHGLADHGAQLSAAGQTGLGSGHKHAHALDINDDTALVLLGDFTFESGLVLAGLLDILPDLDSVQTLLGQHGITLHVVDADDIGLDLVADLDDVLRLHIGICGQLVHRDIARLLAAQIDLHLGGADRRYNTGYLLSCIQSLKRFFQHFLEALFRSFHVLDLFAHRCIYLLNDARRRGRAGCKPRHRTSVKKVTLEFFRPLDLTDHGAPLAANLR